MARRTPYFSDAFASSGPFLRSILITIPPPLHIFGLLGFMIWLAGTIVCACSVVALFGYESIGNRPLLLFGLLLVFPLWHRDSRAARRVQARTYHESRTAGLVIREIASCVPRTDTSLSELM